MKKQVSGEGKARRLSNYHLVAGGIVALLSPQAEVILQDALTGQIIYRVGEASMWGGESIEELYKNINSSDQTRVRTLRKDGKSVRSIVSILLDEHGAAEMLIHINWTFSLLDQTVGNLMGFLNPLQTTSTIDTIFLDDWQQRILTFTHMWLKEHQTGGHVLCREDKRALLNALFSHGAFQRHGAIDYVAGVLSMGRATVYKYLKDIKAVR